MKRKMTIDQLRELVRARKTKGSAFMLSAVLYAVEQDIVRRELEALSFKEIINKYPEYTYDIKH